MKGLDEVMCLSEEGQRVCTLHTHTFFFCIFAYVHVKMCVCVQMSECKSPHCCGSFNRARKSGADPSGETIRACEL